MTQRRAAKTDRMLVMENALLALCDRFEILEQAFTAECDKHARTRARLDHVQKEAMRTASAVALLERENRALIAILERAK
jgi:hypothetical protein